MNKLRLFVPFEMCIVGILICIMFHVFFVESGTVLGDIKGFAIDSEETLYIGVHGKIVKCEDGELTKILDVHGEYCFFIQDDTIILGSQRAQEVEIYDLNGELLSNSPLRYQEADARSSYRELVGKKGSVFEYRTHHFLLPREILRNGEVVYKMSVSDFLLSDTLYVGSTLILGVCGAFFLIRALRNPEVKQYLKQLNKKTD